MKICSEYPELNGQFFDTMEACVKAEAKIDAERKEKKAAKEEKEAEKQELRDRIDAATKVLDQARAEMKDARAEADKIREEAIAKMKEITDPAEAKVRNAHDELVNARAEYAMRYGRPCKVIVRRGNISDLFLANTLRAFLD